MPDKITVAYTRLMLPDADWDATMDHVKKSLDFMKSDDNGVTACRVIMPFAGQRRLIWLYEFDSFEDSKIGSW